MTVNPVLLELPDLVSLKEQAESISLPKNDKNSLSGFGEKKSPFRSRGLDFQEVRMYQPGDDIRQIDWRVTAKYNKPFTKLYTEEKEQQIYLVCDLRDEMHFAGHGHFKSVISGRLTALSAFIALQKKDSLAYALMKDKLYFSTPNTSSDDLIAPLLSSLIEPSKEKSTLSFSDLIKKLSQNLKTGASLIIFSDFHDITPEDMEQLGHISLKNSITCVHIYDELEHKLPKEILPCSDGKATLILDATSLNLQRDFKKAWEEKTDLLRKAVQKYGWGYLSIKTDSPYLKEFTEFCLG